MKAHLFTSWISRYHQGHFVDSCSSLILTGLEEDAAKKYCHTCLAEPAKEDSIPPKIEKLVCAPVLDQLLTESGPMPIDWDAIAKNVAEHVAQAELDDSSHGYWLDCNACLNADNLPASADALRHDVPEDVSTGLNWDPEKSYYFIVHVLSPPKPFVEQDFEEPEREAEEGAEDSQEPIDHSQAPSPELADKDLGVVVRARNALVAAWLWKTHARGTELARNTIHIGQWPTVLIVSPEGEARMAGEEPAQ